MFARVYSPFFFTFIAFPLFAAANAIPTRLEVRSPQTNVGQCNVNNVQCCQSVLPATVANFGALIGLLDSISEGNIGQIGIGCSPITGIGSGGGSSCTASPVCCQNNSFNGVIAVGCSPITINL